MTIEEIPRAFKYTCDLCGVSHLQENAGGHYANSRPDEWATFKLECTGEAWNGARGAVKDVKRLLCPSCRDKVVEAINGVKP